MEHRSVPADALPVRNLLSSRDNATTAASICDIAFSLTAGPISGTTSTVFPASLSSKRCEQNEVRFKHQ